MAVQLVSFFAISVGLIYVSRTSLVKPGAHGFYRFFAWEAILALAVINLPVWFYQPLIWHQLISWFLLLISMYLVVASLMLLRRMGKPKTERTDPTLLELEKTTVLVTTGLYRYIRHPMYSSLLFLSWGVFFKLPSWPGIILSTLATLFLLLTAQIEETENIRFFGQSYQEYRKHTRMFIPGIF